MKAYYATYSLYQNCHIYATREYVIEADNIEEAKAKADLLGEAIERFEEAQWRLTLSHEDDEVMPDFWANPEELYEETETEEN